MIKLNNITKIYHGKNVETKVLEQVSLDIRQGEFICIYGPSGCGKTTLLNIIGLMDCYTEGEYLLNEQQIPNVEKPYFAKLRNQNIGYIFQGFHLIDEMNVLDNVCVPMGYAGVDRKQRHSRAAMLLEEVGMGHKEKNKPCQLSGGEKQRAAIARALSNDPKIILADEPTGSLDQKNGAIVMEVLRSLNEKGKTILMVTHDKALSIYADRVIHILDGKIIS